MPSFRESLLAISVPWMATHWSSRYQYVSNLALDILSQRTTEGVEARFPGLGTTTALPYIGTDRNIDRGPTELETSYIDRLIKWLDSWRIAGHPYAVLSQVSSYFLPALIKITSVSNHGRWHFLENGSLSYFKSGPIGALGNWNWDNQPNKWWRAWDILDGVFEQDGTWDDPGTWDDGGTWDTTATPQDVAAIRRLISKWKSKGVVVFPIINFDPGYFQHLNARNGAGLPDGAWGSWGIMDGDDYVLARPDTMSFWRRIIQ